MHSRNERKERKKRNERNGTKECNDLKKGKKYSFEGNFFIMWWKNKNKHE